jgi:hypothetical protein
MRLTRAAVAVMVTADGGQDARSAVCCTAHNEAQLMHANVSIVRPLTRV